MAMKLALAVRTDLDMGRGKIAALVAHAAVAATLAGLGGAVFHAWLEAGQPKVVLKVATAAQLDDFVSRARAGAAGTAGARRRPDSGGGGHADLLRDRAGAGRADRR